MRAALFCCLVFLSSCAQSELSRETARNQIEQTLAIAHQAWADGDVERIIRHEHPDIHKLISFDKILVGKEASRADLEAAFSAFEFRVTESVIEDFEVNGDTATFYATLTLEGTPKAAGYPFSVRSRTLSVWVRDPADPDQWLAFREIVQAEPVARN